MLISGKLSYKAGKTKDAGKLVVLCFSVEVIAQATATVAVTAD